MKLLTALRSELLKTKRTAGFYFTLIAAALIPAIFLLNILTGGSDLAAISKDPLNTMLEMDIQRSGLVFFPIFVILVCTLLPQVEYRNNTWKQVLTSPQTKANIFFAKFLNINLLVLLFLAANLVFMLLVIVVTHFSNPALNLLNQPLDELRLLVRIGNSYVTMLALCAFQFWLGLRFRNFIIPIAIGFALWFTGMMMTFEFQSGLVEFFPYSFQILPFMSAFQPKMAQVAWSSAGYAMLFLLIGFLDFRSKRMNA
ncbi:MAG TPA: ABC transporter permease [Chitinophagaceae bacterium]|nr:ABC transporter permease [Chitinophagaceae bacterium]